MSSWFYRIGDSPEQGPMAPSELLELIRKGVILEDTLVRKGDSPWVYSVEVNGLWEAAGRPSATFDCPHCGKAIPKPPVQCSHCHQTVQNATGRLIYHESVVPAPSNSKVSNRSNSNAPRFGSRPGLYD